MRQREKSERLPIQRKSLSIREEIARAVLPARLLRQVKIVRSPAASEIEPIVPTPKSRATMSLAPPPACIVPRSRKPAGEELLRRRPTARVLIVGSDGVGYGAAAPAGKKWKDIFLDEVRDQLDLSRVHFLGHIAYGDFISLLQLSTVHVYLTYPSVLSWSLLEAMSAGCAIVASDTQPVREAIVQ